MLRFAPGRSDGARDRRPAGGALRRLRARHAIAVGGETHELEPDTGAFLVPGDRYEVDNPGPDDLVLVSVTAPCEAERRSQMTVRYADRPVLPASPNREFRFLVNEDAGCLDVTQFVGLIPPGRAPMHSHTYDEVVYVVEGEGVLHLGRPRDAARPGLVHPPAAARAALPREHRADADARARRLPSRRRPGLQGLRR